MTGAHPFVQSLHPQYWVMLFIRSFHSLQSRRVSGENHWRASICTVSTSTVLGCVIRSFVHHSFVHSSFISFIAITTRKWGKLLAHIIRTISPHPPHLRATQNRIVSARFSVKLLPLMMIMSLTFGARRFLGSTTISHMTMTATTTAMLMIFFSPVSSGNLGFRSGGF